MKTFQKITIGLSLNGTYIHSMEVYIPYNPSPTAVERDNFMSILRNNVAGMTVSVEYGEIINIAK